MAPISQAIHIGGPKTLEQRSLFFWCESLTIAPIHKREGYRFWQHSIFLQYSSNDLYPLVI